MKAVLFDLDGTLLPMDEDEFTKGYFKFLAKKLCPLGIEAGKLIDTVWAGTGAMVKNDGNDTNEDVFWKTFEKFAEVDIKPFMEACNEFYKNEFNEAKCFTRENRLAKEALKTVRDKGMKAIIATNPIFPEVGQLSRLGWIGVGEGDYDYITSYEVSHYAKPNPKYYREILDKLGLEAEECLMVGNDELEDMYTAKSIGMDTFLITDCGIKRREGYQYEGKSGTFADMVEYIRSL